MNLTNDSTNLTCDERSTYLEYRASILIWKVVPPILILLGTAGNILSILILTRKSIRSSTTALYLTVLAFSDLTVLYTGLLRQWMIYAFGTDIRELGNLMCKINIWLVYSSLDYSAWILVVVTMERVVSAWLPHRAKDVCRKKSATAILISIGVFILLMNAHLMYGMSTIDNSKGSGQCLEIDDSYDTFFNVTWPWIDLCVYCVIPFSVIVIGNGLILTKVLKSQNRVKAGSVMHTSGERRHHHYHTSGKHSYMTAILFTLNIVFLVSATPISIYNVGFTYWTNDGDKKTSAQLDLWWAIVNMCMYGNNTFNFFLYCLSGSKFRHEVIIMFCSKRTDTHASTLSTKHLLKEPRAHSIANHAKSPKAGTSKEMKRLSLPGNVYLGQWYNTEIVASVSENGLYSKDINASNAKLLSDKNIDNTKGNENKGTIDQSGAEEKTVEADMDDEKGLLDMSKTPCENAESCV
ncbi:hypothetical protein ACF0H5_012713 [Mactra antiquata]